ncbi:MAG: hypothetical protein C4538_06305 [Nitrospiraceae bacterium]|nr:MAG: hypothetical protein C4538_06305 [Nitrospiraceae bacterium]
MKGDKIPDQDHVARYCSPIHAPEGEIQATAFMLRAVDKSLSINWLEYFRCLNREDEIAELRKAYSAKKLIIKAKGKIAVLNVGEVCEKVLTESPNNRKLEILHDPSENDPSHSGIYNIRSDDELIAELILETVSETYPAR